MDHTNSSQPARKYKAYKLLVDPAISRGKQKLYRYDGYHHGVPVSLRDPRTGFNRIWDLKDVDLPIPRFKVDENYVGKPPPVEVSFCNLNDNIDDKFLQHMCDKFGDIDALKIYYHPKTNKHLGIAKVIYTTVKAAKTCVEKLHQTSVMGLKIHVQLDSRGDTLEKWCSTLTEPPKLESPPVPVPHLPPEPPRMSKHNRAVPAASSNPGSGSNTPGQNTVTKQEKKSLESRLAEIFHQPRPFAPPPPEDELPPPPPSPPVDIEMAISPLSSPEHSPKGLDPRTGVLFPPSSSSYNNLNKHCPGSNLHFEAVHQPRYNARGDCSNSPSSFSNSSPKKPSRRKQVDVRLLDNVLRKVITELKQILHKDIQKRMVEGNAYRTYDQWWDDCSLHHKKSLQLQSTAVTAKTLPVAAPLPEAAPSLLKKLESTDGGLDSLGLGLGLRASLRNMRSFKIKKKVSSPSPPKERTQNATGLTIPKKRRIVRPVYSRSPTPLAEEMSDEEDSPWSTKDPVPPSKKGAGIYSSSDDEDTETESDSVVNDGEAEVAALKVTEDEMDEELDEDESDEELDAGQEATRDGEIQVDSSMTSSASESEFVEEDDEEESRREAELRQLEKEIFEDDEDVDVVMTPDRYESPPPPIESPQKPSPPKKKQTPKRKRKALSPVLTASPTVKKIIMEINFEHSYFSAGPTNTGGLFSQRDADLDRPPTPGREFDTLEQDPFDNHAMSGGPRHTPEPTNRGLLTEHCYSLPAHNRPSADHASLKKNKSTRELKGLLDALTTFPAKKAAKFRVRTADEEERIFNDFLNMGIDQEDVDLLRICYDNLISEPDPPFFVNETHWNFHPTTRERVSRQLKHRKKRNDPEPHSTGCARSQGYYKLSREERLRGQHTSRLSELNGLEVKADPDALEAGKKATGKELKREARLFQRRVASEFVGVESSELLKFNQLKFRRKLAKFARSKIHGWGLFAQEDIPHNEMVIEYVGQSVRAVIGDIREKHYEDKGIGSSYLFRVDLDFIIDATKSGNIGRFINHSCNPNCYAKVITVDNQKKIVIYSLRAIDKHEEITYDYKFPLEDDKLPCFCQDPYCRGTLN